MDDWAGGDVLNAVHIFPDTEKSSIACQSITMTREKGRREWQKLLNSGFEIDRIPTV